MWAGGAGRRGQEQRRQQGRDVEFWVQGMQTGPQTIDTPSVCLASIHFGGHLCISAFPTGREADIGAICPVNPHRFGLCPSAQSDFFTVAVQPIMPHKWIQLLAGQIWGMGMIQDLWVLAKMK